MSILDKELPLLLSSKKCLLKCFQSHVVFMRQLAFSKTNIVCQMSQLQFYFFYERTYPAHGDAASPTIYQNILVYFTNLNPFGEGVWVWGGGVAIATIALTVYQHHSK